MRQIELGHICEIRNGFAFKSQDFTDEGIPLVRIGEIADGNVNLDNAVKVREKDLYKNFLIKNGDILIAMSGATTGKIGKYQYWIKAYQNQRVGRFIPNVGELDNGYLYHFLKTVRNRILHKAYGGGQPNISPKEIGSIKIPIPKSINDQIRIATVLTQAEKLIAKRKESIKALDELLKSAFVEMFGDPVRNEKGWTRVPLSEILLKIESGHSPVCLHRPAKSGEWGVLKLSAVTQCVFKPNENKALPDSEKPNSEIEIKLGDILFSRKNTYELVAACAYVRETHPKLMMSDLIFRLVPRDNMINSIFLQALLSFSSKRKMVQRLAGGAAGSMPNISKTKLLMHKIEVPPIHLQNQFAAVVEKVEVLKARYTKSLIELENLLGSLSQRAFKGELDLSKVPLVYKNETEESEITEIGRLDGGLKNKLEFNDKDLVDLIKRFYGKIFSFDELWIEIESLTDKNIPSKNRIQDQIIDLLESDKENLQQVFDILTSEADKIDPEKQIAFRGNYEN